MNIEYIHPADQLVMFMQRIYDKGLTTMSGGNLSIMDNDGNLWITAAREAGFADYSSFLKAFRRQYDCAPGQLREP